MRRGLVVILLAACAAIAACAPAPLHGPAWPTLTAAPVDGGESIAPRAAARAIAAVAEDDKPVERGADKPATPAAATASTLDTSDAALLDLEGAPDDALPTEEIIIEIEDSP
jgi:hypothetical protein